MTKLPVLLRSIYRKLLWLPGLFLPFLSRAQDKPEMADMLRSSGKIYVVVLVICTIFVGIIFSLVYLERRIKRLENNRSETK